MAGISREREAQAVNKILSAYTETTKQSATTVAGLESKKAIAANGSNVTQKNNDNGEVVSKQTAGTNQDNNSSNNSITNTTNDSNNTKSNKPSGSETENNKTKSISSAYSGQYHTVKPGQTLYDISMSYYGTSEMVDEIKDRNNIDDDYTIKEGQKYYCLNKKMVSLFSRYCIIFNRFNKGSEIVANKYIRKFRRLKKEGQNSTYMKIPKRCLRKGL